jgi:hypothetical protein
LATDNDRELLNDGRLPRFAPGVPLPPYTYVPGRTPHPISDPAGHSYGKTAEAAAAPVDDSNWSQSTPYLHAVDLFNRGYYWEAHEAWESLWHACGRRGPIADLLKGLIKLAAAGVKVREGRPSGVESHARRAAELFRAAVAEATTIRLGLSPARLALEADAIARSPSTTAAESATPAAFPVFSFRLEPQLAP